MKDNLDGFVVMWTSYTCNDSLKKEQKNKQKTVMVKDRWRRGQKKKQDSSLGFLFSTFNSTHDIYVCVFSGWASISFNTIYCVSVPDENQPIQSPFAVLPVL